MTYMSEQLYAQLTCDTYLLYDEHKYASKSSAGCTSYWQGMTHAALLHSSQQHPPCSICL